MSKTENSIDFNTPNITIFTLGQFDVIKNGVSLVLSSSNAKKIWELYKFMITFRDKAFTPEAIMDQLWIYEDYNNPRSTLRRQMYRLRKILGEDKEDTSSTLIFSNGYYKWNNKINIKIDTDLFEEYIRQGDELISSSPKESLKAYISALDLYTGDYLPDSLDQHWIFSIRNYYKRLYLKAVLNSIKLLKLEEDYNRIFDICQKAIQIDVYEEAFHLNLLEALIVKGEYRQAFEHYKYISDFLKQEMGINPSEKLRGIYKKLIATQNTIEPYDNLQESLEANISMENAFYCEPKLFKSFYEFEKRRLERKQEGFSVGVITAIPRNRYAYSQNQLKMNALKEFLSIHLRKGDIFSKWNDYQFIVMLIDINKEVMETVLKRILKKAPNGDEFIINQISHLKTIEDCIN